tara:strand:- start:323 stop:607 length:285 start_codon:yes stop_codon:yes gene_type:complete
LIAADDRPVFFDKVDRIKCFHSLCSLFCFKCFSGWHRFILLIGIGPHPLSDCQEAQEYTKKQSGQYQSVYGHWPELFYQLSWLLGSLYGMPSLS